MATLNEIATAWAHQKKPFWAPKKSCGGFRGGYVATQTPLFFEGTALYSWGKHYLLGSLGDHPTEAGRKIALINSDEYMLEDRRGCLRNSPSTCNHRRHAWGAAKKAGHLVMEVPGGGQLSHDDVLNTLVDKSAQHLIKLKRAKKYHMFHASRAGEELQTAISYARAFGVPFNPTAIGTTSIKPTGNVIDDLKLYVVKAKVRGETEYLGGIEEVLKVLA